ncbi:MAG: choloylglycine hydrolase [Clostridia bacterium]|nr:choloylglycine hydrolase [Clostridia bacterium]
MCTAVTYKTDCFYFGRTLDNDFSYNEQVTVTPRIFSFVFRNGRVIEAHYAIIGMAYVVGNYPLYYDAMNEKGLCMAGLNFVGNAHYFQPADNKDNIAQFELIPWVLSQCESVNQAKVLLGRINITGEAFNEDLPVSQLHWIIADKEQAITVESVKDGLKIYDNLAGVLTNNPPFNMQMFNLNNYMTLSPMPPRNTFAPNIELNSYSRGMGAIGLPGDLSSQSRFVRAAFTKLNSVSDPDEKSSVGQFFHILGSVEQTRGCCALENGGYEITVYTSCCNADKGIYYYTTYNNRQIIAVNMHRTDLDSNELIMYPLVDEEQIVYIN